MASSSRQSKINDVSAESNFNWRNFLPLLKSSRVALTIGMTSLIASTLLVVWASVILGDICARLGARNFAFPASYALIAGFVLLEILSIGAQFLGRRLLASSTNRVLLNLRVALFKKLNELPMSYFDTQPLGRIITRLTNDVEGVEGFFAGGLARIATACVQIVSVLLGILWIAPNYGLWVVASAAPALGFSWLTRKPVRYWLRENKIRNAHVNSTLAEFIQGLPVLRVLGLEKWSVDEFGKDTSHHLESSIKVLSWNSFIRPVTVFLSVMPTVVAALLGGIFILRGQLELASVVAVIRLTERFSNPVRTLTQEIQVIQDATASAVRVAEMLGEQGEVSLQNSDAAPYRGPVTGHITFKNVHLAYKPSLDVLSDFNLTIPAGQKIGIIGATGAGKSSLINLIPGLYRPRIGRIEIDGVDIARWELSSLRGQIGYVAQEPFLVRGSLGDNLLGIGWEANVDKTNKFMDAVKSCGLDELIRRFPGGLTHQVRENGSNLSSGEKQMISFMRLLQEDRPILLMDEATSCLDSHWESAIQRAILVLMSKRKRTCVIIAHRLETLRSCDRIIKLSGGKIIADGAPVDILIKES
jgi:ABC-type multidrug transport system fused ATPase/permease subunit